MNNIEAEVDAIRDKILLETKDLTRDEQAKRLREKGRRLAAQYGFKIVPSVDRSKNSIM